MSSTRQAAYKSIITIILVSLLASLLPVSVAMGQVACRLTVYANGPYEVWAGYEECPSIVVDDGIILPGYYAAPSFGYVFLGGASSTNSFDDNYQYYVIATRSLFKLDAIQRPNGNFISKADSWKAWGNVHRPLEFDEDGKLIGDFRDYSHQDYIYGPPDGLTEDVGLPPQYCCVPGGVPFQGFVAVRTTVPVILVHGWGSSADAWDTSMFTDEGFVVETFEYKTRQNITKSAGELADTIKKIKNNYSCSKVDIVAHSEGGLVSRYYIERGLYRNDVRKLIMISTPNHGLDIKRYGFVLAGPFGFLIAEVINGPAGRQMAPHTPFLIELNGNNNCADLHPDEDKTTTLVDYYTLILQSSRPTISHKHFKIFFIPLKITWWVKDGDFVVAEESLKLTGATHRRFEGGGWLSHCEETKSQDIIDQVISYLRNDPPKMEEEYATSDIEQIPDVAAQWSSPIQDTIYLGEVKNHTVLIDNATTKAYFNLFWPGSDLDLVLYTPSSVKINSSVASGNPSINYTEGATFEFYDVQNPEPGNWTMEITAIDVPSAAENYSVITFMETSLFIGIGTDKDLYVPNEPITVVAYVQDNGTPLLNANVTAKISRPDEINSTIQLYDDGAHGDGGVNDGIYGNTYTDTAVSGLYDIVATAQATINDEYFAREAFTTVWVEQYPDLTLNASNISFLNDDPLAGENITINATIHNIGDADANNASILFYDGDPANGTLIGEDIINVSVDTAVNASVSWNAVSGVHEIYVIISPYNEFLEENYTNNQANKTIHVCVITQLNISLLGGWNLISAPLNLTTWELGEEAVVGDPLNVTPKNSLTSIYRYNTTSGLFEKCDHFDNWGWWQATGSESFTDLELGWGYWVMAKNDCNLTFTGTAPSNLNITLNKSWNLIGWYSVEEVLLGEEAMVGNPLNVTPKNSLTSIYRYNTTEGEFEKCDHFDNWGWWQATGSESFTKLEPGRGYWVMAKNDCVWRHGA